MILLGSFDLRVLGGSAAVGILCGFTAAQFYLSFLATLFLWGVGGVSIGHFAELTRDSIIKAGAVYGFFLTISFLFFRFGASFDKFFTLLLLTLALSVIGMIGGVISVAVGSFLKPYMVLERPKKNFDL